VPITLSRLADEVDEIGRELAQLIGPGSAVSRARRAETRALLREAFHAVQDGRDEGELGAVRKRLHAAWMELGGPGSSALAERMSSRGHFGAVDQPLVDRGAKFKTVGQRCAENIADVIDARVERTLSALSDTDAESDDSAPRALKTRDEVREIVSS